MRLADLDLKPIIAKEMTIAQATAHLGPAETHRLVEETLDTLEAALTGITDADVVFEPNDPNASDPDAKAGEETIGWTLGHVVVHVTASLEESTALGSTLARGVEVTGRSRYETPWETVTTVAHVRQRLAESRRICRGFLSTWPDQPDTNLLDTSSPFFGEMNAVARTLTGCYHATMHFGQVAEILRQSRAS